MQVSWRERAHTHNPVIENANVTAWAITQGSKKGNLGFSFRCNGSVVALLDPTYTALQWAERGARPNTVPGVPRAASWLPVSTTTQPRLHIFGQQATRKELYFLAELLSVKCPESFPTILCDTKQKRKKRKKSMYHSWKKTTKAYFGWQRPDISKWWIYGLCKESALQFADHITVLRSYSRQFANAGIVFACLALLDYSRISPSADWTHSSPR